ncbi:receptor-type tyrosine-protein phosphatase H-like isoform X2 [Betta splendens]|uniref:protein-tyrosine-phosphatase n=1 Tax=Betta splendens TaxID=158456 RepID=A0A9W2XFD3_BETSP|nr:receptor-type tyrosine-protein phosphatase H-like isoform X2 [Betta splendens]
MKLFSFKITSDHLLLFVLSSLLWGLVPTESVTATTITPTQPSTTSAAALSATQQQPPENVKNVTVLYRNVSSITLAWDKVKNISTYFLQNDINQSTLITYPSEGPVKQNVFSLTAGTKYNFTLITTFNGINSTGYTFSAVTEPQNTKEFKSVGQNETSITLQWKTVDANSSYVLRLNGVDQNISASQNKDVTYTVPNLTSGTRYLFTLFTVLENVRSTGVNLTAVTVPSNADGFKAVGQNETSITLQWKNLNSNFSYVLRFNGEDQNISATQSNDVTYIVLNLTSGTRYLFTLFTVFDNVRSTGVNLTAVTEPRNPDSFAVVGQNETSITLQWNNVNLNFSYELKFNNKDINVPSAPNKTVTYTVPNLTSGTKYVFTLFAVLENVRSTGVNLTAVTVPSNADGFKAVGQNETSITLQWKNLNSNFSYVLRFGNKNISVNATQNDILTYTASNLTSGINYSFTLFTVFEKLRSTGVNVFAVTVPRNADGFRAVGQNETSITLQWERVNDIPNYTLRFNKQDINISTGSQPLTHTVLNLESGTKYDFALFTLLGNVRSTGVNLTAVTAPGNVKNVTVLNRSVNSITLTWDKVKNISTYTLQYDNYAQSTSPTTSLQGGPVVEVSSLKAGTEYNFTVITVFEGVNSTGYRFSTVTAIDCAGVPWHVSNSSIQGRVDGLFMKATATNGSQTHVSVGGGNVSFSDLYAGATYQISLVYGSYTQCRHNLTILPPGLRAHCEYWASGYSIRVEWNKPDGVWTEVELNVTGQTHSTTAGFIVIPGFSPAKTYEVSVAALSGTLRSSVPFVFQCSTDPRGVIGGSVFGVLLVILLVCLIVFILLRRPELIRKNTFVCGSELSTKKSRAISVEAFAEHFRQLSLDDNRGFSAEYESLIPVGTEQTRKAALLPENKPKNRFNNVLPYDWCRVKLTTTTSAGISDYINANYMPGYNTRREYIATQGPLPSTVNDFWRMVWEQNVRGVVMVTNCTEGGRTKCEQYWPADSNPRLCGDLLVTTRSEEQAPNWTLRQFSVKHRGTTEKRRVRHLHFTSWPDHGVPQCTKVLIQFRGLLRHHIETEGTEAPTVVHCSAGVGRTGTIIALDVLLQQLEKKGSVNINGFVHQMRLSRPHMVQTESQYVFLHQCIMDSLQSEEKTDEHIYENTDMIYANAAAIQEFQRNTSV